MGLCHLEQIAGTSEGELSYLLDQPYWRQGVATEAACAVVHYGFEHSAWDRVVAATLPQNVASQRVLAHLGFLYENGGRSLVLDKGRHVARRWRWLFATK